MPEADSDITIVYGVPKNPEDLTKGWKSLNADNDETLASKKLTDLSVVAFALVEPMDDEEDVEFEVELPSYEDDA